MTEPVEELARAWAAEVEGTSYVPMGSDELVEYLTEISADLVAALRTHPTDTAVGHEAGRRLVAAHFTGPSTVERTVVLLCTRLPELLGDEVRGDVLALAGRAGRRATRPRCATAPSTSRRRSAAR